MRTDSDFSRSKLACTFTLSTFSLRVALALPLLAAPGFARAAEEPLSLN